MSSLVSTGNCKQGHDCRRVCSVHTADADATKQFRRVGVVGVYWALGLDDDNNNDDDDDYMMIIIISVMNFIGANIAVQSSTCNGVEWTPMDQTSRQQLVCLHF